MSTTTTPFGAAEAQAARTLIGGTTLGDTRNELLKQILVATANKAGGSGGAAWGDITGTLSNQADLQAALDAKLSLAGGTMTGALINSTNGAVSAPAVSLTGTVFTGGSATTTKPLFLLEPSGTTSNNWSTGGTVLGVNAASGFGGDLINLQIAAVNRFRVASTGVFAFNQPSGGSIGSFTTEYGAITLSSNGSADFVVNRGILAEGDGRWIGASSEASVRAGRLYAAGDISQCLELRYGTNANVFRIYGTYTDGSNYERLGLITVAGAYQIKPEAAGTGTLRELHISGLPTSNPGPGILWNDGGVPKIGT